MKRSTSFAFDLIKTLNPSEKTYIKKQIGSSGKHMLQLFSDLSKCSIYNKENFIKNNKGKTYIQNLSQNQTYLYKKIIEELINYRSKTVFEIDMHNKINEILILIDKKFYSKAKKVIDNCFNKALAIEDYVTCYSLIEVLLSNINNKVYFGLTNEEIKHYRSARNFYLIQLNRVENFRKLNDIYYDKISPKEKLDNYKSKLKELDILDKNNLPDEYPIAAKSIFYFSKAEIAKLSKNNKEFFFFNKVLFDLYESRESYIQHKFSTFLGVSINYLYSILFIHDFSAFFHIHKKVVNLIAKTQKNVQGADDSLIYVIQYYFLQTAYNNAGQFANSIQFANEYETFLEKKQHKLSGHFIAKSYIEIALACLYNKKYEKALTHLEPTFNSKDYYSQYIGRILKILIHYTLKDEFLLDSLFQSFIHYLKTVEKKDQIPNIHKLKKHVKNNTVHHLKNEDFEDFVYIHWDLFEKV